MEQQRTKLPPVAVTVDLPLVGTHEKGQEVILTFHAIPDWVENYLGFAIEAMGWRVEKKDGNIVCFVKMVKGVVTFSPAYIEGGGDARPKIAFHERRLLDSLRQARETLAPHVG